MHFTQKQVELNWIEQNWIPKYFWGLVNLLCVLGDGRLVRRSRELGAVVIHVPNGDQQAAEMKSKRYHQLYHIHSRDVVPNLENHHNSLSSSIMDLAPGPNNLSAALSSEILHKYLKSHLLHHFPGNNYHIYSTCQGQCFCVENGNQDEYMNIILQCHILISRRKRRGMIILNLSKTPAVASSPDRGLRENKLFRASMPTFNSTWKQMV